MLQMIFFDWMTKERKKDTAYKVNKQKPKILIEITD